MKKNTTTQTAAAKVETQEFHRLDFLRVAMNAAGATQRTLAEILGRDPAAISYVFKFDDARLEDCEHILKSLGFNAEYSYAEKNGKTCYTINSSNLVQNNDGTFRVNRLAFVDCALRAKGIKKNQLAKMIDVHVSTLLNYFAEESCFMSVLYRIGEALDLDFIVRLRRFDDSLCAGERARGCHLRIELEEKIEEPYDAGEKRRQRKPKD